MLTYPRNNPVKNDYTNVEFRLGEIERLSMADGIVASIGVRAVKPQQEKDSETSWQSPPG
jgi:hypothetical protein